MPTFLPSRRAALALLATAAALSALAKAYLDFRWSPEGQEIIAKNNFRPRDPAIFKKHAQRFANIKLFTVDQTLGGWAKVSKTHFADGGSFDQVMAGIKR